MPRFCEDIQAGDKVIVDTRKGRQSVKVIGTATMDIDSEGFKLLCAATGATLPLKKVLKRYTTIDMEYTSTEVSVWEKP